MSAQNEAWTPYGLEAIRIAHLRRRRILTGILVLGLLGLWLLILDTTTSTQLSISVNGKEASGINIDLPNEQPRNDKVTVAVDPGRVTQATTTGQLPTSTVQRTDVPTFDRGNPLNWSYFVLVYGPYVLLGLALYLLAKRRGKHDQVNYGIYKGAMPLELISKTAERQIFTTRHAKISIFGKRRADYLPPEILQIERVPQEGDE